MRKHVISSYLALIYGLGLICFETLVNWGQWQWWPYWLVDYVAAALLILGGIATLNTGFMVQSYYLQTGALHWE